MGSHQKSGFIAACLAIAAGMGGELHIPIPGLGILAMLDVASYVLVIPILCSNWNKMGKFMRRSIIFALAWTTVSLFANMLHFENTRILLKGITVVSSSWAIMTTCWFLLKDHPTAYLWYMVGAGVGGWIALYYFRNGAMEAFALQFTGETSLGSVNGQADFFMDKQIYPPVARMLLFGCTLPLFIWWKKLPVFFVLGATMFAGFYLLFNGGSRSSFGMFCAAAAAGYAVSYATAVMRRIGKHPMLMVLIAVLGCAALFGGYKYFASTGAMGDTEKAKYEYELGEGSEGALKGRAGIDRAFKFACDSGFVGCGSHFGFHSVFSTALSNEGVVGAAFWIFFYLQCLWLVCRRIPYSGKYASFIVLMILTAGWDVFGSPFGARHKFFMLMAFIALCRDNPYYAVDTIFDKRVLGRLPWMPWSHPQPSQDRYRY